MTNLDAGAVLVSTVPSRCGGILGRSVDGGGMGREGVLEFMGLWLDTQAEPFQVLPAVDAETPVDRPERPWYVWWC